MRLIRYLLLSAPLLCAAEPTTTGEWITSLAGAYQKQRGYIAACHSEGPAKSLDVTLASDPESGLAVLHVVSTKGGQRMEIRQWSTEPGDFYIDVNGRRGHVLGVKEEIKALGNAFTNDGGKTTIGAFTPELLLTKTEVNIAFSITSRPAWEDEVEEAKLGKVTDESVTFITRDHGELTISRDTGLVIGQSVEGENNEQRILTMVRHQKNPGQDAIVALTKGWSTAGAEPIDGDMLKKLRLSAFQSLVQLIDDQPDALADLKKQMASRQEQLDAFAALCIKNNPESALAGMEWEKIVGQVRSNAHKAWEKKVPEEKRNEEDFRRQWSKIKGQVLTGLLQGFERDETIRRNSLQDIFGGGPGLKARTATGKEAKEFLESALCHAYLKETVQKQAGRHWEPEDPAE